MLFNLKMLSWCLKEEACTCQLLLSLYTSATLNRRFLVFVDEKPFDFFLLSRILSALFTLLVNFIEIITGAADSSVKDGLCRFHVSLLALPHLIYLLNLLLSLAECYGSRKSSDGSKAVHFLSTAQRPFLMLALNLLVALVVNWMYLIKYFIFVFPSTYIFNTI